MIDTIDKPDAPPQLSRMPRGAWRCVYRVVPPFYWSGSNTPGVVIDGDIAKTPPRYPSREVADEAAAKEMAAFAEAHVPFFWFFVEYLGAEFVPADGA